MFDFAYQILSKIHLPDEKTLLQILPDLLEICGFGNPKVRPLKGRRKERLAYSSVQSVEPRRCGRAVSFTTGRRYNKKIIDYFEAKASNKPQGGQKPLQKTRIKDGIY